MASFQAKIGLERPRKRENKNFRSNPFLLDPKQKIPKKRKKFKNLKNNIMASFQANIGWERPRKREKKKIVPMGSYPTWNRKFQKYSKKIKKNLKTPSQVLFKTK